MAEPDTAGRVTAGPTGAGLGRWMPGFRTIRHYRRGWLHHDLVAGLVLTAFLVPVGMGYAQAAGLPPITRAVRNHRAAAGVRGVRPVTGDGAGA